MTFSLFVESLRRLYVEEKIDADRIEELYQNRKITENEKSYILNTI